MLIALAVVLVVNLLSAKAFGEFEFWAAIAKVGAIVIFLVVGLVVVIGGFSIGGHVAGFQNLWSNPGGSWPASGDFNWYGPLLAMSGVVFAYAAIEMVGVAAGEMQDSKTEVPKGQWSVQRYSGSSWPDAVVRPRAPTRRPRRFPGRPRTASSPSASRSISPVSG